MAVRTEEARREEALLRLSLGERRAWSLNCLEVHFMWLRDMKELAALWAYALRSVEFEKERWDVLDVFGGMEEAVMHWALPAWVVNDNRSEALKRKNDKENEERWEKVEAAGRAGGIEHYLQAYWTGVGLEDILA